jgi:hypothetical protein
MPYYKPIKTIASVAGLPGGGSGTGGTVIVSNVEPTTRDDGSNLREGDFWFQPSTELTYIYAVGEWQIIGSNVDYGGDFIIDGGDSLGNGFIDNNPGDGSGGGGGGGVTDTSDLPLAFAGLNPFDNLKITDLPPTDNLVYQSDANTWFLEAIIALHGDVDLIEKDIENLNNVGATIEFKAKAPITVQAANKVVQHGFDISTLNPIS